MNWIYINEQTPPVNQEVNILFLEKDGEERMTTDRLTSVTDNVYEWTYNNFNDCKIIAWKQKPMSFINDQEKMVDFFTTTKEEFLNFYSYLTEEEYEETKKDVLARSGYWNAEALSEDEDVNGIEIGKIVQSIMMTEWLLNK